MSAATYFAVTQLFALDGSPSANPCEFPLTHLLAALWHMLRDSLLAIHQLSDLFLLAYQNPQRTFIFLQIALGNEEWHQNNLSDHEICT